MTRAVGTDRRTFVKGAVAASLVPPMPARAAAPVSRIVVDPRPMHALSPYLHMQFMEPLGATDGSVEASWNHLTAAWRPDLVEATRALAPPMLRWGGLFSAYYRWREAVGPRDRRRPMQNLMWGGVETNQVGTAEFWDFCRQVGAAPLMCVNFLSEGDARWAVNALGEARAGDAAEAAAWVSYCNAPDDRLRREHGRAAPMPIRHWQIGNETSYATGRFDRTAAVAHTAAFARAMRAVDPDLSLIAWGDSGWGRAMIEGARGLINMLAFHDLFDPGAVCGDAAYRRDPAASWQALMASVERHDAKISAVRDVTGSFPLALTESHYAVKGRNRGEINACWATGVAFARFQNLHQRHGDVLRIANIGDFCGTRWMTNVVMLPTPRGRPYLMPVGKVAQLYAQSLGRQAVRVRSVPTGLDVVASRSEDRLFVHVVNTDRTNAIPFRITIDGHSWRQGTIRQLTAADSFAPVLSADEDPVEASTRTIDDVVIACPPASVSVIQLSLGLVGTGS